MEFYGIWIRIGSLGFSGIRIRFRSDHLNIPNPDQIRFRSFIGITFWFRGLEFVEIAIWSDLSQIWFRLLGIFPVSGYSWTCYSGSVPDNCSVLDPDPIIGILWNTDPVGSAVRDPNLNQFSRSGSVHWNCLGSGSNRISCSVSGSGRMCNSRSRCGSDDSRFLDSDLDPVEP
uniref:Uncharacterized protein n=1 Tax=Romanomermis culicivorax TaxID=13658 RepID=A0A915K577_ROMCU